MRQNTQTSFTALTAELSRRAARAVISQLSPVSDPLRTHLSTLLYRGPGETGGFLADPVFEAGFGWQTMDMTMTGLAGHLLHAQLVAAMDGPPAELEEQRFRADWAPYQHQYEAWELLRREPPHSVVVSSGTGSGKTECFLVPILDALVRQSQSQGPLVGVQALLLYPLNALINSQRDRLRAWTARFRGAIRFCLYNGDTPEHVPTKDQQRQPEEVLSRQLLRDTSPPILVTNSTMLEYMLVRQEDRPILDISQGKLQWIVLDEAHTYVGSHAAEIALLLRRVLHAFGVEASQVRFVATSATIGTTGDPVSRARLQQYLANIAGIDPARVAVIEGFRRIPAIPSEYADRNAPLPPLPALRDTAPEAQYTALASHAATRRLRHALITEGPQQLTDLTRLLTGKQPSQAIQPEDAQQTLATLDVCRTARLNGDVFLPLRAHLFQRTQSGLWVCCNPACAGRLGTALAHADWPYGQLFLERRERCDAAGCGACVFELVLCETCGAAYLAVEELLEGDTSSLRARRFSTEEDDVDEELLVEEEDTGDDATEESAGSGLPRLLTAASSPGVSPVRMEVDTGVLDPPLGGTMIGLVLPVAGALQCLRCGQKEQHAEEVFRPARVGAAFLLRVAIPTLLEHTTPASTGGKALPFDGRRLITFSDSRQGTARFALQAQLDAERNYVRSWLYHQVHANRPARNEPEIQCTRQTLQALERVLPSNPSLTGLVAEQQKKLQDLETPPVGSMPWREAVEKLTHNHEIAEWMPEHWRHTTLGQWTPLELARFCLFREFSRRPKRQNSLETLGLLSIGYPALDRIPEAHLPPVWRQFQLGIQDWRDLLKITLDFLIRGMSAVVLPEEHYRWVGTQIRPRFLVGPDAPMRKQMVRWPQVRERKPRSRLVVLLFRLLKLPYADAEAHEKVNDLLRAAWDQLRPVLVPFQDGYKIDLEQQAQLRALDHGWLCPVTRRVLDVTLRSLTPYITPDLPERSALCMPVQLPVLPYPFGRDQFGAEIPPAVIAAWLESDTEIRALRECGVWTEFSDRIAAFSPYFRVAEHSAQQSSGRLRSLETSFKAARLNVLSCSTTMEMGVDIGGVSAVAMNNAPPGPANFLQRAGRAGRRGETAAVSLTLCQSVPHGEAVFTNPLWPFRAPVHVPHVSLQSERIVQRHVNALALTRFLQTHTTDLSRLESGWFFLASDQHTTAPVDHLRAWLREHEARHTDVWLREGFRRLTARSAFAGVDSRRLLEHVASALDRVTDGWHTEHAALVAELVLAGGTPQQGQATPAQLAIQRQLQRLRGEYLLGDLASMGFLPGYGFPTLLVPFVTSTLEQLRKEARQRRDGQQDREDTYAARRRGYPSRELSLAIRDYAPGSDVVIDGQVYMSQGVTLNWHIPPSDYDTAPEIQAFRYAWRCRRCGASGTRAARPEGCPACGAEEGDLVRRSYLQPAGFAVDILYRPHNDLSYRRYIPVRRPWITAGLAPWSPLPHPECGRYRFSAEGHIFHRTGGIHSHGLAICLRCGRAASEVSNDLGAELPKELQSHYRLRGGREMHGETLCPGNEQSWAIKRHQWLGIGTSTDVFELQLHDPTTGAPVTDDAAAFSLAVALRQAFAEELGITEREIGCGTIPSRTFSNARARSVVLYDTAVGGAGFVASVPAALPQLLRAARRILECQRGCDRACHACLLTYNTQHEAERLDRHKALAAISPRLLEGLALPPELRFFGPVSCVEFDPLPTAIGKALQRADVEELRIYLGGSHEDWDLLQWPLRSLALQWGMEGRRVALIVPEGGLEPLPAAVTNPLASLLEAGRIELRCVASAPVDPAVPTLIAEVGGKHHTVRWATTSPASLAPGEAWSRGDASDRLVRVTLQQPMPSIVGVPIAPTRVRRPPPETFHGLVVVSQWDGAIQDFGTRIWDVLSQHVPRLRARLQSCTTLAEVLYRDRYLHSPLAVRLIAELLKGLQAFPEALTTSTNVVVETTHINPKYGRLPMLVHHDWQQGTHRKHVFETVLMRAGLRASLRETTTREAQHARELIMRWHDGTRWTARFDHGLTFLTPVTEVLFPFDQSSQKQAERLAEAAFALRNPNERGTYCYLTDVTM
jgi:DEAD/DEAH box helicase domain-containing protein